MSERTRIAFWSSTLASVLLLGAVWVLAGRVIDGGFALGEAAILTIAALGLSVTFFVAARIVYVLGRAKKRARAADTRPSDGAPSRA